MTDTASDIVLRDAIQDVLREDVAKPYDRLKELVLADADNSDAIRRILQYAITSAAAQPTPAVGVSDLMLKIYLISRQAATQGHDNNFEAVIFYVADEKHRAALKDLTTKSDTKQHALENTSFAKIFDIPVDKLIETVGKGKDGIVELRTLLKTGRLEDANPKLSGEHAGKTLFQLATERAGEEGETIIGMLMNKQLDTLLREGVDPKRIPILVTSLGLGWQNRGGNRIENRGGTGWKEKFTGGGERGNSSTQLGDSGLGPYGK